VLPPVVLPLVLAVVLPLPLVEPVVPFPVVPELVDPEVTPPLVVVVPLLVALVEPDELVAPLEALLLEVVPEVLLAELDPIPDELVELPVVGCPEEPHPVAPASAIRLMLANRQTVRLPSNIVIACPHRMPADCAPNCQSCTAYSDGHLTRTLFWGYAALAATVSPPAPRA
jgi:hypothetical protein